MARRILRPAKDIGELTRTRSRSASTSTSALVGECVPPSTKPSPLMRTGRKNPGMAHDAATASGSGGWQSRPNTTRRPSRSRTAHNHSGSLGQAPGASREIASAMKSTSTVPSGASPAKSANGRASNGWLAARASLVPMSVGRRSLAAERTAGGCGGLTPGSSRLPAADMGRSSARASRSAAESPARSEVPVIDPADVPTTTAARRGSQPVASSTAARTPAWKAPPATPPAPSTRPTRSPRLTPPTVTALSSVSSPELMTAGAAAWSSARVSSTRRSMGPRVPPGCWRRSR